MHLSKGKLTKVGVGVTKEPAGAPEKVAQGSRDPHPDTVAQADFFQGVMREWFLRVWGYVKKAHR